jgi:hypothetical protein
LKGLIPWFASPPSLPSLPASPGAAYSLRSGTDTWYVFEGEAHVIIFRGRSGPDGERIAYRAPIHAVFFEQLLDTMDPLGRIDEEVVYWFDVFRGEPLPELLSGGAITDAGIAMYAARMIHRADGHPFPYTQKQGIPIEVMQYHALKHFGREIAQWDGSYYLRPGGTTVGWHGYSYNSGLWLVLKSMAQLPDGSYDGLFNAYHIQDSFWGFDVEHDGQWAYGFREYLLTGNNGIYPEPFLLRLHFSLGDDETGRYIVYHKAEFP